MKIDFKKPVSPEEFNKLLEEAYKTYTPPPPVAPTNPIAEAKQHAQRIT